MTGGKRLEDFLSEKGYITTAELKKIKKIQLSNGKRLSEVIADEDLISEGKLAEILAIATGIPQVSLSRLYISQNVIDLVPEDIARKHTILPIEKDGNSLVIAVSDPYNIFAVDDVKFASGCDIRIVIASKTEIQKAIDTYYKSYSNFKIKETAHTKKELKDAEKVPVVKLVDTIIYQAVKKNASDIHIEPQEKNVRIRYRVDGELVSVMFFDKILLQSVIARIKIMAKLDITKKRIPQDGSFNLEIDDNLIDIRVSTIPTTKGEKAVLRILNRDKFLRNIDQLGFSDRQKEQIYRMLSFPYGMILVCGPTGCGKTTTLYSMINYLNKPNQNIVTLEDPVEYALSGINQIQINPKSGITFATGLRAILRQDPNIIMVGEIRDKETADIAVRAALTGHLVFSTLHTNNALGAITRLLDMGVESYLLASCLVGVISQRLVRKICPICKEKFKASKYEASYLDINDNKEHYIFKGKECEACNFTGYKGRTVVGEIFEVSSPYRELISKRATLKEIESLLYANGYDSMESSAASLVKNGITTLEEMMRVVF
ncbi:MULTISPECIES: GspE/PulE family protein [Tepidanaerobacter]|mgnify:CR=1 FL=1|uniref:Type IV pilus assembly protein PilB n=1 Tax=Tepidanaerobacter syntrophicus TaxID=224999 RepID=A0A0U9HPQ1_9FIRM|nr:MULTISPECIES: GspE/PulE family protein [Tepidanaerobacter]GAQ26111.1 type IV pilus assembly protein PilB [Tepidanaerobacter syntrophicus]GLI50272.1 hypothetical protein TSYNTROOL_03580 [Tepidanaerobacter syntrophicus]